MDLSCLGEILLFKAFVRAVTDVCFSLRTHSVNVTYQMTNSAEKMHASFVRLEAPLCLLRLETHDTPPSNGSGTISLGDLRTTGYCASRSRKADLEVSGEIM